jgi:phage gpG-like protein
MPTDLTQFDAQIAAVAESLKGGWDALQPATGYVVDLYAEEVILRFDDEDDWPPLRPSTLREKSELGYPPNILVRTGELQASLTPDAPGNILRIDGHTLTYGTGVEYAEAHQCGNPDRHLPQREILLPPSEEVQGRAATILGEQLAEIANNA